MEYPYEKLLIKVVDVLATGIGTGIHPFFIRWQERQKALADADKLKIGRLAQEQIKQVIREVRAGRASISDDLKLISHKPDTDETSEHELENIKSQYIASIQAANLPPHRLIEVERQINLDQIAVLAIEEARATDDETIDEAPIDPDWFAQWRNMAQDVSNEDMQRLWARVLAGEAKSSGRYSVHTLDFLSRMSRREAELFAKVAEFVLDNSIVFAPKHDSENFKGKVTFEDLLLLDDLGLISGTTNFAGSLSRSIKFQLQSDGKRVAVVRGRKNALVFYAKSENETEIRVPGYHLSVIGRQLLTLAEIEPSMEVFSALASLNRERYSRVMVGDVSGVSGNHYNVENLRAFQDDQT